MSSLHVLLARGIRLLKFGGQCLLHRPGCGQPLSGVIEALLGLLLILPNDLSNHILKHDRAVATDQKEL